jgi:ribosomal protein S18 acetylase RimI-like enzyme
MIVVRPLGEGEREWVRARIEERWGSAMVVAHGVLFDPSSLPGIVAEDEGRAVGLLTYRVEGEGCEIVTIDAFEEGEGVGTALIDAVKALGYPRLWLVTTNDNVRAQRFYERLGFGLVAVHEGAVDRSRRVKPEIPLVSDNGTPIRDELEYEFRPRP